MPEFVRADAASIETVERFLREEADPAATVGPLLLATGRIGAIVSSVARASAVTLGPLVFLERPVAARLRRERPVLETLDGLFVHEAVHVWQWRRDGAIRFASNYLYSYLSRLSVQEAFDRLKRNRIYRTIPAELEAFELERRWIERRCEPLA